MGVPFLAKHICKRYPNIIDAARPPCSRLFLDTNCAIHQCANNVLNSSVAEQSTNAIELAIIQSTIDYIHKLVEYAKPQDLMMIAIDGLPPRAKMVQQRKRRFVSSWRDHIIHMKKKSLTTQCPKSADWDRNSITPGTSFMDKLSKQLTDHFNRFHLFPFSVIVSDSNQKGEGEAKIMDHIRNTEVPPHADVVYGLDADLIMLSLQQVNNDIYLLRETAHYNLRWTQPLLFFNIATLRNAISNEYKMSESESNNQVVWDYVVLSFMLGNDFIPPLSFLKIKHNGMETIMQVYKRVLEDMDMHGLVFKQDNTWTLNYLVLLRILEHLKNMEDGQMCEADVAYYGKSAAPCFGKRSEIDRITAEIDNFPMLNKYPKHLVQPEKPGWRLRFYNYLLNVTDVQDINDICMNYLQGIHWTFRYYFDKSISNDWYYKFAYSPSVMDLYNFVLTNMQGIETTIEKVVQESFACVDYDTDLQLLMVLPPSSKSLLKPQLQPIMSDVSLGCVHYFPTKFTITTYLKTYLWECSPNLPGVDAKHLSNVKNSLI